MKEIIPMKIKFDRFIDGFVSCTFCGGGQTAVVAEKDTPEMRGEYLDFLGNLATRAFEKALENERRETEKKICKEIANESKQAITNYIAKLDPLPKRTDLIITPQRSTNYWEQGLWAKQNPYIVGGLKAKADRMQPKIEKVIFNFPATIVFWSDGTKTVVQANNEPFDSEKGLAMAIAKKFLGNKGNYYDTFKKYIKWGETDDQRGKH